MSPVVLQPDFGGGGGDGRRPRVVRRKVASGERMVSLPQFFLLWSFRSRREKQAIALVCLSAARPWSATPGTTAQQVMWRSDPLSPPLDGSYCLWAVDSCFGLERPYTLSNEMFVGTPGLVNRLREVDQVCEFDLEGVAMWVSVLGSIVYRCCGYPKQWHRFLWWVLHGS